MLSLCIVLACLAAHATATPHASSGPVLVVGATGQTGSRVYLLLQRRGVQVTALVRNASKARRVLHCNACDESDGIFVGDVTKPQTLKAPVRGAGTLVIATGPDVVCDPYPQNCSCPAGGCPIDVDWRGGKNVISAFARATTAGGLGQVVMISADSTTYAEPGAHPEKDPLNGFYKLNCEAFLMASGLPFTIIKPCGLTNDPAGKAALDVFHDDERTTGHGVVARSDIARLVLAALSQPDVSAGLRFDLCTKDGTPTPDSGLLSVLQQARFTWQSQAVSHRR